MFGQISNSPCLFMFVSLTLFHFMLTTISWPKTQIYMMGIHGEKKKKKKRKKKIHCQFFFFFFVGGEGDGITFFEVICDIFLSISWHRLMFVTLWNFHGYT